MIQLPATDKELKPRESRSGDFDGSPLGDMTRRVRSNSLLAATVSRPARMASALIAALVIVSHSPLTNVQAADGHLDSTFGNGGLVKTDFSGSDDSIGAIVMQPDGKIVVAGATSTIPSSISAVVDSFALARYNSDGSLDQSFGTGGRVITNTRGLEVATSLALLPDGKILAGGTAFGREFAMARYNSDGGLDASFGRNGVVVTELGSAEIAWGIAWSMAVQPDGKILLGGSAGRRNIQGNIQASSYAVVRYEENGGIDSSFGNQGKAIVEFSSGFDFAYAIALQADGKIVLAGRADLNSSVSPFAITRFNGDGSLDSDFGSGGKVTTNFFGNRNQANAIALQSDGKIVVAGWADRGDARPEVLAIARYNSNGGLDATFGSRGMLTNDFFGRGGEARAIKLQRDGKIVVAGLAGFLRSATVRYNGDGRLDSSFGDGGATITDFGDVADAANAIAFQQDGKIVVAGSMEDETRHSDFAIARYNNSTTFEFCVQDDSSGDVLEFNSTNGDYSFTSCSTGFTLYGTGTTKVKGCKTVLNHFGPDRNVSVVVKTCRNKANASVEALSAGRSFSTFDSNLRDDNCACR
jgi:uncharacterized delta-60 repeat protein